MDEPEEKRRDDDKHSFIGKEPPQNAAIEKLLLDRGVDQRGRASMGRGTAESAVWLAEASPAAAAINTAVTK